MHENANKQLDQLQASSVPRDWAVIPLGKLLEHVIDFRGRTPLKLGMQWGGGEIPALSAMNVQMGCIDLSRETYYGSESLYRRWMTAGDPKPSDVLFTMEAPLGNVAQVLDAQRYIISQRVVLLRFNPSRMTNDFAAWQLRAADVQSQLVQWSTGTTATGIQRARLVHLPLRVPPLPEQRAIAAVLDTINDAIQKTEQIIAKLQQVKQGLLHDLLTRGIDDNGELRDPERHPEQFQDSPLGRIPNGWNPRLLHEVAEIRSGVAKNEGRAVRDPVLVHYLRVANVQDGYLDLSDMATICIGRAEVDRFRVLPGDVLMNEGGDLDKLGRGTIWRGEFEPCIHQNHVFVVRCGCDLLPEFLDAWTLTRRARNYFLVAGKQTTNLASINRTAIGRLPLVLPPRAEQRVLFERIAGAEKRSEAESANLRKLRLLKAGLSEDLLTGRVRTTSLPEFAA